MNFDWILYLAAVVIIIRYLIVAPASILVRFVRGWRRVRPR